MGKQRKLKQQVYLCYMCCYMVKLQNRWKLIISHQCLSVSQFLQKRMQFSEKSGKPIFGVIGNTTGTNSELNHQKLRSMPRCHRIFVDPWQHVALPWPLTAFDCISLHLTALLLAFLEASYKLVFVRLFMSHGRNNVSINELQVYRYK